MLEICSNELRRLDNISQTDITRAITDQTDLDLLLKELISSGRQKLVKALKYRFKKNPLLVAILETYDQESIRCPQEYRDKALELVH